MEAQLTPNAYYVVGPECSGVVQIQVLLAHNGMVEYTDAGEAIRSGHRADGRDAVLGRTYPYGWSSGRLWPNIKQDQDDLTTLGYNVRFIVAVRDLAPMVQEQIGAELAETQAQAMENVRRAYAIIFSHIATVFPPFYVATYRTIISHPQKLALDIGLGAVGRSLNPVTFRVDSAEDG